MRPNAKTRENGIEGHSGCEEKSNGDSEGNVYCCLHSSGLTFDEAAARLLGGPRRLAGSSSSESLSCKNERRNQSSKQNIE